MNLLVLTPLVPYPPHDGDKLRLYYFLKELKKRGHRIDLFCLTRVKDDFRYAEDLRPLCRKIYLEHLKGWDLFFNLLGGALLGQSMNVSSYFSPRLRDVLRDYWKSPEGQFVDAVLAHRLRMAPMAFESNPGVPVVLELTDSLTAYTERLKRQKGAAFLPKLTAGWDHWFLKKEEVEWGRRSAKTVVISPGDSEALRDKGLAGEKIEVIPNGFPPPAAKKFKRPIAYPTGRPVVCFVGNMGYFPNEDGMVWFFKEVWPRVKQQVPEAFLAAVGGQPRKRLKALERPDEFLVTGRVPVIEPYVAGVAMTIAPLMVAAGMQNKVALSVGLGIPLVASSSAVRWMGPNAGRYLKVSDDPEGFAQAVLEILKNPQKARIQAKLGRAFILKNYRWADSGRKMEAVLKKAIKQKHLPQSTRSSQSENKS